MRLSPNLFCRQLSIFACLVALLCTITGACRAAELLKDQPSAFLKSFAGGPTEWMPWGEAAFARAKKEQKPVLLVIGTFTSELSRAMNRQTFSNTETAAFLNETFICVLVDAKEQRGVAALYQQYLQTVKQLNGLPMNIWLTPELKPFEGANYLPPTEEWGKEGFSTVAKRAAAGWKADPAGQRARAEEAVSSVAAAQSIPPPAAIDDAAVKQLLGDATAAWQGRFDATNGGFGDPPKYLEPELLRYLLTDPASRDMALTTLRKMIAGAVRDPLDGGFFRYAVDGEWHHPYFQKTLADQARLSLALLEASKLSGDTLFADAARDSLNFTLTRLRTPDHDFASAEDATSDVMTASYFWSQADVRDALGASAAAFNEAYGITADGNIPADAFPGATTTGQNILYRLGPPGDPAAELSLRESAAKLLAKRQQRQRPLLDDNATSGAHGLMLQALSLAGTQLQDKKLAAAAREEYEFIHQHLLMPEGGLRRLAGRTVSAASDDYAFIISGLLTYASLSKDSDVEARSKSLIETMMARFWNPKSGRYFVQGPDSETGHWARVVAASPGPADLPSAEATMLTAIAPGGVDTKVTKDLAVELRKTVAADVKDAAEVARGDWLLALRTPQR